MVGEDMTESKFSKKMAIELLEHYIKIASNRYEDARQSGNEFKEHIYGERIDCYSEAIVIIKKIEEL